MTIAFQTTNARPGRRLTLCAAIFCLITTTCWGVDDGIEGTEQLFGTWANLMVNGKFGKDSPWLYYGDVSLRTTETGRPFPPSGQGYQVSAVVTHDAIGYRFDEHNSVHVGYAFQYSAPPLAKQFTNENRAWEQYTYSTPPQPISATSSLGLASNNAPSTLARAPVFAYARCSSFPIRSTKNSR
jgi:hypothetical protein